MRRPQVRPEGPWSCPGSTPPCSAWARTSRPRWPCSGATRLLSPHISDIRAQARDFFHESISLIKRIAQCDPDIIGCDMHPEYYSSWVASQMECRRVIQVQHHHAHIASCMAENRITGDVIGLAMDGTGYGLDRRIWGGEFLVADEADFQRAGHIRYFPLPGGDAAVKQPRRVAAALLMVFGTGWGRWRRTAHHPGHIPSIRWRRWCARSQTVFTRAWAGVFDAVLPPGHQAAGGFEPGRHGLRCAITVSACCPTTSSWTGSRARPLPGRPTIAEEHRR